MLAGTVLRIWASKPHWRERGAATLEATLSLGSAVSVPEHPSLSP